MEKAKSNKYGLEIKNLASDNSSADLYIYGDIVSEKWWDDEVSPQEIAEFLNIIKGYKALNMYVNSGGGSVFAAVAIYNQLKRFDGTIIGHVDGIAASSASWLLFAADRIYMPENTLLFVHKAMSCACGNAEDFLKAAEELENIENSVIVPSYQSKMNISAEEIKELMKNETYINAQGALDYGIIEEIGGEKELSIVENNGKNIINGVEFDFRKHKKLPENFVNSAKNTKKESEKEIEEEIDYTYYENSIKLLDVVYNLKEGS